MLSQAGSPHVVHFSCLSWRSVSNRWNWKLPFDYSYFTKSMKNKRAFSNKRNDKKYSRWNCTLKSVIGGIEADTKRWSIINNICSKYLRASREVLSCVMIGWLVPQYVGEKKWARVLQYPCMHATCMRNTPRCIIKNILLVVLWSLVHKNMIVYTIILFRGQLISLPESQKPYKVGH